MSNYITQAGLNAYENNRTYTESISVGPESMQTIGCLKPITAIPLGIAAYPASHLPAQQSP